jgi:hypothetical protein
MATVTIELSAERYKQLQDIAARYKVSTEDLARLGVEDLLARPDEEFQKALRYVLAKNADLYRSLAGSN